MVHYLSTVPSKLISKSSVRRVLRNILYDVIFYTLSRLVKDGISHSGRSLKKKSFFRGSLSTTDLV